MRTKRTELKLDLSAPPLVQVRSDESQTEVLSLIEQGGPVSVFGFPGTGKTLVAELAAASALGSGRRAVVLSADRHSAAELSARIVRRVGRAVQGRPAVTPASLAMTILEARAEAVAALPLENALAAARAYQPQMVTGAEQTAALDDLLRADSQGDAPGVPWPEWVLPEARGLPAFLKELRDLLMRAAERGLDAVGLAELGHERGRSEWVAAAYLYQRYLDTLDLRNTADAGLKLDAAALVSQAQLCLRDWEEPLTIRGQTERLKAEFRPAWDLVIADDYQEASLALHHLMAVLAAQGAQVVCLGSPDTAAQSFRGALPAQLAQSLSPSPVGWEAREAVLGTSWRQSGALLAASSQAVRRLRPSGRSRRALKLPTAAAALKDRSSEVTPAGGVGAAEPTGVDGVGGKAGVVEVAQAGSQAEVAAVIAGRLRRAHVVEGVKWGEMAVLTRTAGQVLLLRSLLAGAGLPVRVPGSEVLATDHPAVAPLVTLMECAAEPSRLSPALATQLAASSIGGLDAADLRLLRRHLSRSGRQAGSGLGPEELLVRLLRDGGSAPDYEWLEAAVPDRLKPNIKRLRAALTAGREAVSRRSAGASLVLWAIWQATELAARWAELALAGGPRGVRADADLDAVLALFAAAGRHDARKPGSGPVGFVRYLEAQQLPSDTIAAHAPAGDRVTVSTATAAVGREWEVVALAGLEEDVWPDLRLRDTLLGAGQLADILDGKDVQPLGTERRRGVLEEETRTFALALSRARSAVLAVAVANQDEQPSRFFRWLAAHSEDASDAAPHAFDYQEGAGGSRRWPFDLRGTVAQARYQLIGGTDRGGSARVLAILAALGVDGAAPSEWPGQLSPSVDRPLYPSGAKPVLSPSRVDSLSNCPLQWALEKAGGSKETGDQARIGTLIHWLAERYPAAGPEELEEHLERHWSELQLGEGYTGRRLRASASQMVRRLGIYQLAHRDVAALEAKIATSGATDLPVRLRGRIDRLEDLGDGRVRVVD
ncbi:MAG: PD-(D/E)XK nuclease family protein, partial [Bifidobacteriaceae bacterium]|nr:PD-(D/E)XK nuclease family protein [Bifidobacteriaceae bacterium]